MSQEINVMPVLPLRGITIFPEMVMHFDVGREKSIKAVEVAMKNDELLFAVAQKDADTDEPTQEDLYDVGTIVQIKQMVKISEGQFKVLVKGKSRAKILEIEDAEYMSATVAVIEEERIFDENYEALIRSVAEEFERYAKLSPRITEEVLYGILGVKDSVEMIDLIVGHIPVEVDKKQEILGCIDLNERMFKVIQLLTDEIAILSIQKDIYTKVKQNVDKSQKEYYLREQIKVIQEELGDKDGLQADLEKYKNKMAKLEMPQEVKDKLDKELKKLEKIPTASPESASVRTYIEVLLDLPWGTITKENRDLKKANTILNKGHYGLTKVKERVLEYLAVKQLSEDAKAPIICLVGPPGVGKTSIAKSIAEALGRNYVRISLGGVRDESEIRGHRRTYVGAIPGRFVYGLTEAKSMNPLMLLDEVDKMAGDFRGDPAAALLEILDSKQNNSFRDHYLELPLDLSQTVFIATANSLGTIPRPLLDRMEVIEVSSYTELEKLEIAQKYLLPAQLKENALTNKMLKISKANMSYLISHYTKEAGVRGLERTLGKVCRKAAKELVETEAEVISVTSSKLKDYLGAPIFDYIAKNETSEVGIVRGLAWTSVGGDTLSVEVNRMKGKGRLQLTGKMGDVMKESAQAAVSYIRSKADELGVEADFYEKEDLHIHIPEGAVPKDGPSAGITMATAMISALTDRPVKANLAMTGEITIRGRVLPIGGLKEKLLAAKRAQIDLIIVPIDNKKNVDEMEEHTVEGLEIVYAKTMDDVLKHVFI